MACLADLEAGVQPVRRSACPVAAGSMFPAEYNGSLFAPQHGSWDRTFDIGYRLTNVKLGPYNLVTDYQLFATGWLQNQNTTQQSVWGKHLYPPLYPCSIPSHLT